MEILNILQQMYLFDVWVFTQWWLYAPFLIPAIFYFIFFVLKWITLTLPIWLPIVIVIEAIKTKTNINKKEDKE